MAHPPVVLVAALSLWPAARARALGDHKAANLESTVDAIGNRAADNYYVRQNDREFFIAFAQRWRSKISESAMRTQAATNDRAPEMYRVSTVRNFDAWYDAFDVRSGERLYLEPSARVRIW